MLPVDKQEMIAQVEWALRMRDPFTTEKVKDLKIKWKPVGLEMRFEGGIGIVAHFEGRSIEMAWLSMSLFYPTDGIIQDFYVILHHERFLATVEAVCAAL